MSRARYKRILEEGLEKVYARHTAAHQYLLEKLEPMGWKMLVDKSCRLPMLNALVVPESADEANLRARLLDDYHMEISTGLGSLAGKIVRVGLMGYNAKPENIDLLAAAMKEILVWAAFCPQMAIVNGSPESDVFCHPL